MAKFRNLFGPCGMCGEPLYVIVGVPDSPRLQHGENPEHSKPYNEHESTYDWLISIHDRSRSA